MHIAICNHTVFTHSTLAFGRFFCKNVTFESFLKSNFTCTGNFKALFCATVGFNLWHYNNLLWLLPAGASAPAENLWSLVGNVPRQINISGCKGISIIGQLSLNYLIFYDFRQISAYFPLWTHNFLSNFPQ